MNLKHVIVLVLLQSSLLIRPSSSTFCKDWKCECSESVNSYQVYCPQKEGARVQLAWQEGGHGLGEVVLTCTGEVSAQEIIGFLEGQKMRNLSKIKIKQCLISEEVLHETILIESEATLAFLVLEELSFGSMLDSESWTEWDGLKSLSHLEILYSDGLVVGSDMFKNLNKLETVIFRDNTNTVVKDEAFSKLRNLNKLELSKCDINQLQANTFENLIKLKEIDLDSNQLTSLPQGLFRDLESLEEINLSLNRLGSLPTELFGNLKQLKRLNLNHNQLTTLLNEGFQNTSKLERLEMNNNDIGSIPTNTFKMLNILKLLDLSGNKITEIDQNIFQGTQQLSHLHLHHNQLKRINLSILGHKNSALAYLELSHNSLATADIGSGIFSKLVHINLSNNRIKGSFSMTLRINCRHLSYIDLSNNSYNGTIKKSNLDVFKRNLTINLSHNGINRIDMTPPRFAFALLKSSSYHTEVMLVGNPLVCDCFASELKERLKGRINQPSGLVFQDFPCEDGNSLSGWSFQDLSCIFPGYGYTSATCTDSCSCSFNKFYRRVIIDCESRNLTGLPEILPIVKGTDFVRLKLQHNLIETIGDEVENITNYDLVDFIDLSDNRMEDLNHNYLPPSLSHLILFNNNLTNFSKETLEYFENSSRSNNLTLNLGNNPYSCDCSSAIFYHFLQNYGNTSVKDHLNISLHCPEKRPLYQESLQDFCSPETSYSAHFVILISPLIMMVMVLICYCNRKNFTIWLFSKPWAKYLFPEDITDNDKEYDAFISYSHHDAEFVEKTLYPGLATPSDSSHAPYKCCIHTLHWQVGRMIPDQIVESVANSRRTIIILSKGYIEAVWTKLEFRAAHKQALQDKSQVL